MIQFEYLNRSEALELVKQPTPTDVREFYDQEYNLDPWQIDFYEENGYIKLESVLAGDALYHARRVIQAAVLIRKENDKRELKDKSQYEQSFLQCGYLAWDFPAVKDFVFGKRFASLAAKLMQKKHVRLWHDQALFKESGGRQTDVHHDSSYWPVAMPSGSTTMWLALNNVPVEKGCLYFYPKSHKSGLIEYVDIFKNPHYPEGLDPEKRITIQLRAGDVTFHSGLTFHGAGENSTDEMREGMTVIYIEDGMRYDASDARNATHTSCKGLRNGDLIDTKYTPILY